MASLLARRTPGRRLCRMLAAGLACCYVAGATAAIFDDLLPEAEKDWKEVAPELPAPPQPENLAPFYVSATSTFQFTLDRASLSFGPDRVLHFTLVATSSAGARSVTFLGMRCSTRQYKVYAYGRPDGGWDKPRTEVWKRIDEADANRQYAALYKDIMCADGVPDNLKQVRNRLAMNPYDTIPKD